MARIKSGKLGTREILCNICGTDKFTQVEVIRNGYVCKNCFAKGLHLKYLNKLLESF